MAASDSESEVLRLDEFEDDQPQEPGADEDADSGDGKTLGNKPVANAKAKAKAAGVRKKVKDKTG